MFTGRIYKITSNETDAIYIGSTSRALNKRLNEHRTKFKLYLDGRYGYTTSFDIIMYEDHRIEQIAEFQCETLEQLYELENFMIGLHPTSVNRHRVANNSPIQMCECGGHYTNQNQYKHRRSKRHTLYIAE